MFQFICVYSFHLVSLSLAPSLQAKDIYYILSTLDSVVSSQMALTCLKLFFIFIEKVNYGAWLAA